MRLLINFSKNKLFITQTAYQIRTNVTNSVPRRRVVITGVGVVSPLANNLKDSWQCIIAGATSIKKLGEEFDKLPCQVAAQIDRDSLALNEYFSKSDIKLMSTATQFAVMAAEEALANGKLKPSDLPEEVRNRFGVCVGMGMFDLAEVYASWQQLQRGYNRVSPFFVPRLLPSMACGHISMRHGLRGPNHSVSTACATGAHAIGDAMRFIRNGDADLMLAGSGESCIEPLSIAGFCRLRALSTTHNNEPEKASRPFDKKRDGFVMGEGSAVFLLEELEHALQRNAPIFAEVLGYGLSGDAYHITSPSEDGAGATLAMQRAIADAGVTPKDVSYINAHATSTPTGDRIEAHAIGRVFEAHAPQLRVSSTKGAHGHLLGSSGNLEAAFVVQACVHNILPPSINIDEIDDDIKLNVVRQAEPWSKDKNERRIALKNSFGFGGTNASLCIASFKE